MAELAALFIKVRTWMYVIVLSAVLIALDQMSGLLAKVAGDGAQSADMSVLTRPQIGVDPLENAVSTWISSQRQHLAAQLIQWSIIVDGAYIVLYGLLLWRFIEWCRSGMSADTLRLYIPFSLALAADVVEDIASLVVSDAVYHADAAPTWSAWTLVIATWLKWASLIATVLFGLAVRFAQPAVSSGHNYAAMSPTRKVRAHAIAYLSRAADEHPTSHRVWTRLRVQVAAAALYFIVIAVPLGGALDQVPDTVRTVADGGGWPWQVLLRALPVILLLCPAIWAVGRLALLDRHNDDPGKKAARSPGRLLLYVAAFTAAYAIAKFSLDAVNADARLTAGGFAIPLVAGVVLVLSWVVTGKAPWSGSDESGPGQIDKPGPIDVPRGDERRKVREASLILTVLPLAAFGLCVMRAFLLESFLDPSWRYTLLVVSGIAIAVGGSALAFYGLKTLERKVLRDEKIEAADVERADTPVPVAPTAERPPVPAAWPLTIAILSALAAALLVSVSGLAVDPFGFGRHFHGVGIIATFLAALVVLGGVAQYRAEIRAPMRVFRKMHLNRGPVLAASIAVFVAAGYLGADTNYHDVRTGDTTTPVETTSLSDEVTAWGAQALACADGARLPDGSIPMLFVAAPGGGIRAAYWTDHALARIEQAPCGMQRVFAASGVSGGSVGLAVRYAPAKPDGTPTAADVYPTAELAKEKALAANTAAQLFRDLPASVLGVTTAWDDRAAVLERAWEKADPALTQGFYATMKPGVVGTDGKVWRPVLVFNGTEVDTGCRLLVSPMALAAPNVIKSARQCRSDQIRTTSTSVVPASLDEQDFSAETPCPRGKAVDLTIATAAHLSARFPYVSPTGGLAGCREAEGDDPGNTSVAITDSDGGANENSGIATLIDIWQAIRPAVADFPGTHGGVHLTPVLVLLRNGYVGSGVPKQAHPSPQLIAPRALVNAQKLGANEQVLLERAQSVFGPHVYIVAPKDRPTVQAPLGWTLSKITQRELDSQLTDDASDPCREAVGRPSSLACLLTLLNKS
jgi:hypothetical protein